MFTFFPRVWFFFLFFFFFSPYGFLDFMNVFPAKQSSDTAINKISPEFRYDNKAYFN